MSESNVNEADLLKPQQRRALIHLAFLGGGVVKAKELRPELDAKLRKDLVGKRMLKAETQTKKGLPITLDDAGWRWVMDNLANANLPPKEQVASMVMKILERVDQFLKVNGLVVQDLIQARRIGSTTEKTIAADASAEQAVLKVALELGGGHIAERIRLRDLRPKMEALGYSKAAVDQAIRDLQREGILSVIRIDMPTDIDDRDRAAIIDIAGEPRHALIVRRRPQ